ncbi:MAG: sulfotransferase family 2 domain-containing protein [Chitinophagales bacterium]|nr:sulfotransferase family 2 domain-containing protein [Chitinophagales bacterium]
MVICHHHRFIFLHNYKVAGTSIREALQVYTIPPRETYPNWIAQKLGILPKSSDFEDHISAPELKAGLKAKYFNKYYKFSFVRNPWDWQVSLYHYAREEKGHHQRDLVLKMSFEEYIHWRVNEDLHLQKAFMYDAAGNCLVDFIGKLESINEDFKKITAHIGIEATLPHSNKSKHTHYRDYYNDGTRALVAEAFKEDIELFDYQF